MASTSLAELPSPFTIVSGIFALKFLLFYCYYSTDFEVHRNWMAVVNEMPIIKWYTESTSIWTLDYPPLFAWFEKFLSLISPLFDPKMLNIQSDPHVSSGTVLFQRLTVILADIFLLYCSMKLLKAIETNESPKLPKSRSSARRFIMLFLIIGNAGLIMVDNIHFQYNSFLSGILLLSFANEMTGHFLWAAFWYCILINCKHIYLYLAPAYIAYYLKHYIFQNFSLFGLIMRCAKLLTAISLPFVISFGPFVYNGSILAVMGRLFPLQRGLTHAYWAPNFWAIYNGLDIALNAVLKKTGKISSIHQTLTYTSGLVQEHRHAVLMTITPLATLIVTGLSILPFFLMWLKIKKIPFLEMVLLCAFNSFLFGYHVHEKAVLLISIPFVVLAVQDRRFGSNFVVLATTAHVSLFPLFFTTFETPIKFLLAFIYTFVTIYGLRYRFRIQTLDFNVSERCYMLGYFPLEFYKCTHNYFFGNLFPFAPLMLTSIYCSIGIIYAWMKFCWLAFFQQNLEFLYKFFWRREQENLKKCLIVVNDKSVKLNDLTLVAGFDISASIHDANLACAALVILRYPDLKVVHTETMSVSLEQPYIPGYLAFREANIAVKMLIKLRNKHPNFYPQVVFIDGNGILHPAGFGLACHIGVLAAIPAIGVAKNLHTIEDFDEEKIKQQLKRPGSHYGLLNSANEEIGAAFLPKSANVKNPVFISVGHKIDLDTCISLTAECCKYRVPEPIRQADAISRRMVRLWWDE